MPDGFFAQVVCLSCVSRDQEQQADSLFVVVTRGPRLREQLCSQTRPAAVQMGRTLESLRPALQMLDLLLRTVHWSDLFRASQSPQGRQDRSPASRGERTRHEWVCTGKLWGCPGPILSLLFATEAQWGGGGLQPS